MGGRGTVYLSLVSDVSIKNIPYLGERVILVDFGVVVKDWILGDIFKINWCLPIAWLGLCVKGMLF